jgi:hypothetical protein
MASGSSKAKQPSQKGEVFAFPARMQAILNNPLGFLRPDYTFESLSMLDIAIPTLLDCVPETVDIHSTDLMRALLELVQFLLVNGSLHDIIYFLGPKPAEEMYSRLNTICYRIINDKTAKYPKPEFLLPAWLACILASELSLEEERKLEETGTLRHNETRGNPSPRMMKNVNLMTVLKEMRGFSSPAVLDDSTKYIREKLQAPADLRAEHVVSILTSSLVSIHCLVCMGMSPARREIIESQFPLVEKSVEGFLPPHVVQGLNMARFISKFGPMTYQLKCLVKIYSRISPPISNSDPLSVRFWKTAGEFLKILKTAVNQASTKVFPIDYSNVANLNRLLLQCLVSGVSKTICYTEIESVSNEIEKAVAVCKDWASLDWIAEIEAELQIVKEVVLPFLQKLNPGSYRTASVDVLDTPGFLDLSTQAAKAAREGDRPPQKQQKKTCAACGTRAAELFKCNGCHSVSYCDKECQRKHWPTHKQACKEAQKRG